MPSARERAPSARGGRLSELRDHAEDNIVVLLVGNKSDLKHLRVGARSILIGQRLLGSLLQQRLPLHMRWARLTSLDDLAPGAPATLARVLHMTL